MKKSYKFSPIKHVMRKPIYLALAIFTALLFYLLNVAITHRKTIFSFINTLGFGGMVKFFLNLSINFYQTITPVSLISLLITSALVGVLISMIVFKINLKANPNKKTGVFGIVGILIASLAPGCAACGLGLVSALGLGAAALTFLPFDGLEISFLAILILIYAIHRAAKDLITCEECKIL